MGALHRVKLDGFDLLVGRAGGGTGPVAAGVALPGGGKKLGWIGITAMTEYALYRDNSGHPAGLIL